MTIGPSNKSEVRIESSHCYRCGGAFSDLKAHPDKKRTMHHGIPQALKPERNILMPVCDKCHKEINNEDPRFKPKIDLDAWASMIDNIKKFTAKQERILNRYIKREEANETISN